MRVYHQNVNSKEDNMAKATAEQWDTAIANYRRTADQFRQTAAVWPEGNWRKAADLRVAAKADADADRLEAAKKKALAA